MYIPTALSHLACPVGERGEWKRCCYGHYQFDGMLDFVTGNYSGNVGDSNNFVLRGMDPTSASYQMPYIYENFNWNHCEEDFHGMIQQLHDQLTVEPGEPTSKPSRMPTKSPSSSSSSSKHDKASSEVEDDKHDMNKDENEEKHQDSQQSKQHKSKNPKNSKSKHQVTRGDNTKTKTSKSKSKSRSQQNNKT
jgi:hypothetical protein